MKTANEFAKSIGVDGLREAADIANTPVETLERWYEINRELFECVIVGASNIKMEREMIEERELRKIVNREKEKEIEIPY